MTWRPLRADEAPFSAKGIGPAKGMGEIVCPDFDTWALYEMVWVDVLGRVAKQGPHALVLFRRRSDDIDEICECACGRRFTRAEAQLRKVQ